MARTNIDLDDQLIEAGLRITKCKTKKDLVNFALKELVSKKGRKELLDLEGKVVWEGELSQLRKARS